MVRVENLQKSLAGAEVLRDVSLCVEKGEFLALIGGSGSGKSVLLKHIAGLMQPDSGRIWIDGEELGSLRGSRLEKMRRRYGFVFQNGALFDSMTVYDNLAFPLREKTSLSEAEIGKKIAQELEQVELEGVESKYPAQLSGGMVKRTALARALIMDPEIIFFDEPTTGLDPIIADSMLKLFERCHQRLNLTGIIVTHLIPQIFSICQKAAMLHEGKIISAPCENGSIITENQILKQFAEGSTEGPVHYQ